MKLLKTLYYVIAGVLPAKKEDYPGAHAIVMERMAKNLGRYLKHYPKAETKDAVSLLSKGLDDAEITHQLMLIMIGEIQLGKSDRFADYSKTDKQTP